MHHPDVKVLKASNGVEAFKILENHYTKNTLPSLVISDINMPLMDGLEIYNNIQEDHRFQNMKVVLFTTSALSKKLFLEKGIAVFTKPFSIIEYENVIVEMLHLAVAV